MIQLQNVLALVHHTMVAKSDAAISHTVSKFYLLNVEMILFAKYIIPTIKSLENFINNVLRGH